jgi:enoyl-CoA hydratase/carnithine racemase
VHAIAKAVDSQPTAASELAIASTDVKFATRGVNIRPFLRHTLVRLGRNVGSKRALDRLFTGEPVSATTALRDELRVVSRNEIDRATMGLAKIIAGRAGAGSGRRVLPHEHGDGARTGLRLRYQLHGGRVDARERQDGHRRIHE